MIHITAQMRVLVAIEAVDGRKGIDSLVRVCQAKLSEDPIRGCVFIFRSRRGTSIRVLAYDGQGYWLAQSENVGHTKSLDNECIYGHRSGTSIDNGNGMLAGSQAGHFADCLLGLTRASC
jgi:hypothetical protein